MPVICFASSKGGVGKSTSAVLLAAELVRKGAEVVIIDADPNRPVDTWARRPARPERLSVLSSSTEASIIDDIEAAAARVAFVIVDLEGTASLTVAYAISRADLVVIPSQGSQLDAAEAAKAIRLIRQQEKAFGRRIPHAVLFTRTSAAIRPRTLHHIRGEFDSHGVPSFATQLHEREAFRAIFSFGGTVDTLTAAQVGGLEGAVANVRAFAAEVVALLRRAKAEAAAA
jgi:chromosome partitioning protein